MAESARPEVALSGQKTEFEDFQLLNPEGRKRLVEKYAGAACEETIDIDWAKIPYNRVAVVNHLVAKIGPGCRYLEIGCDQDQLFAAVPLTWKIGVDPVRGGNRRLTSDAFFDSNTKNFDVIFIDGLHTYEQLHRDVDNALKCLRPGGFIAIHDLIPRSWKEEHVPRLNGAWTGDVWKVGAELAQSQGLDFRLISIDHGVGVVRRHGDTPLAPLADLRSELASEGFADFYRRYQDMPTVDWDGWLDWLETGNVE